MIETLFNGFDFTTLKVHVCWFALVYMGVMLAMLIDLVTGVRKAKAAGKARTSEAYKRSCDKAIKYFFPMVCLSFIDLIVSTLLPVPAFTMAMGAFNIFCEFKSVMEKTHEKEEIRKAEKTMSIVLENKDEFAKMIAELIKEHYGNEEDTD